MELIMEAAMNQEAVEPVVESTVVEEIDNAVQNEGQETAQEVELETKPEPPKEEPIPKGVQKRIDRAVRQKYEAEARANELERRLQQLERPQQQQKADGEPKIDQFENIEDYVSAKAAFVADQRIQHTLTTRDRDEAEKQAQTAQRQSVENWNKKVQLVTADLPDFDDVVSSSEIRFQEPAVLQAIQDSDIGPRIAYFLASNPDEADEVAKLRGSAAIRAIGRIEAKLEFGKISITKTPPPIEPTGTKAKAVKAPDQMSDQEFSQWRKRHIAAR